MRAGRIETSSPSPGVEVLALSGEHDLSTADELREAFRSAYSRDLSVIVDLSEVGFIDSSIVAVLVECGKPTDGDQSDQTKAAMLVPANASPSVRRVIDLTGLDAHLAFVPTMDEALEAVSAGAP